MYVNDPLRIEIPTPFLAAGAVNAWLLPGPEPLLVDCGPHTDEAWQALLTGLAALGHPPPTLRHLVITHAHPDHFGNAARLRAAAPGMAVHAPDLAHARAVFRDVAEEWDRQMYFLHRALVACGLPDEEAMAVSRGATGIRRYAPAVEVDHWLTPGQQLDLNGTRWEVANLQGHTLTQIGLLDRAGARFLSADHLLPHISSNALLEPPAPGERHRPRALPRYIETLQWTRRLPPMRFYPGHGLPFDGQHALIDRRLAGIEQRADALLAALHHGPRSVLDLVHRLFPDLDPRQIYLAISEVVGHLDVLEARGQVGYEGAPVRSYFRNGMME